MGVWNERSWSADYVLALRGALDAANMSSTRIIVADGGWDPVPALLSNASFAAAVYGVGVHYPSGSNSTAGARQTGKPLWSSEDSSTYFDSSGGGCLARILSWNYVYGDFSALVIWNLITSYYEGMVWYGDSLMLAATPWSGHYADMSPLWAMAHWAQFAWPGWRYLPSDTVASGAGDGGSGLLPGGGTYVTLVDATVRWLLARAELEARLGAQIGPTPRECQRRRTRSSCIGHRDAVS
mgnify:CR=1 FL=1